MNLKLFLKAIFWKKMELLKIAESTCKKSFKKNKKIFLKKLIHLKIEKNKKIIFFKRVFFDFFIKIFNFYKKT